MKLRDVLGRGGSNDSNTELTFYSLLNPKVPEYNNSPKTIFNRVHYKVTLPKY